MFNVFEINALPSEALKGPSIDEELSNCGFDAHLLGLDEIEKIKDEEFYFEIVGKGYVEYISFWTDCGTEHDMEFPIEDCRIALLDKKIAEELGGISDEVDEDVLNAVLEEENNKTERIFRD